MANTLITEERILSAALKLIGKKGLENLTTQAIAREAGVNEVTLFRRFGDKASVLRALFKQNDPTTLFESYPLNFDPSNRQECSKGLLDCMLFLTETMEHNWELMQVRLDNPHKLPGLEAELAQAPQAARNLLQRILDYASPSLLPGVLTKVAALNLLGTILITIIWKKRAWMKESESVTDWEIIYTSSLRSVIEL